MASLRLTLLRPRPGMKDEAQRLLEELDRSLASSEGLLMSFVTQLEGDRLGRIALWHSRDEANHEATRDHVLAVRSRLHYLSLDTQEMLMDVKSGHVPRELTAVLAGDLDIEAAPRPVATEVG